MQKRVLKLCEGLTPRMRQLVQAWLSKAPPPVQYPHTPQPKRRDQSFFEPWRRTDKWFGACEER